MSIVMKVISLFVILIVACQHNEIDNDIKMVSIDLDNVEKESVKDWFDLIELIPLATSDSSLIKGVFKIIKFDSNYYIYDGWQHSAYKFDSIGNFVYSTKPLQGSGPDEFVSFLDFDIDKTTGNWHILDHVASKIRIYDRNMRSVGCYNLNKDLLPLQYFKYIKDDLYLFYCSSGNKGEAVLKFYKAGDEKIVKKNLPIVSVKADFLPNTLYSPFSEFNGDIFFTQKYPNNELFKVNNEEICVEKYLQFSFKKHTFDIEEIEKLDSKNKADYIKYLEDKSDKAFIFTKSENDQYYFISVYYEHCVYIIKHDKLTAKDSVIVNDYSKKGSLGRAVFLDNEYYYCVANSEDVNILVEDALLTEKSKKILSQLKEDDNPCIIKYRLKRKK